MQMTYERTMTIRYNDEELTDMESRQLAHDLQVEGLSMIDWGYGDQKIQFGFLPVTTTKTRHVIKNSRGKIIYSNAYKHNTLEVYNQIKEFYKVTTEELQEVTTVEEWVKPKGNRLIFDEVTHRYEPSHSYEGQYIYPALNDTHVYMTVKLLNGYNGVSLSIKTVWDTDKIQRSEVIKDMLVELPLQEVGKIQNIVESCLSEYRTIPENPVVDCHFDAKTETRSECSPDIIKLVREARNQ